MATRLVPFLSWAEWESVGKNLFAQEGAENQQGLNRVAVWRYRGRVPVAVESTAELVEIRLRDPSLGCSPASALPEQSLRCLYSMSIVRFVNGVTDQGQKGRSAIPVAALAEAAGLPRLLVDIRHEAVHNELPSLQLLRMASQQALSWLQANYWSAQKQALLLFRAATHQGLLQLAALQGPQDQGVEPSPQKKRKKGEKQGKKKQKTGEEVLEKERARLVRELSEGGADNLVDLVLEAVLSRGGGALPGGLDSNGEERRGRKRTVVAGVMNGPDVISGEQWRAVIEALAERLPHLPSMLLSELIQRLTSRDRCHGAGLGLDGGIVVDRRGTNGVDGGSQGTDGWGPEVKDFVLWLLGPELKGQRIWGFSTPLLKELLRRCLNTPNSSRGGEVVRALMTRLAENGGENSDGSHFSDKRGRDETLSAKMQVLLRLATVRVEGTRGMEAETGVEREGGETGTKDSASQSEAQTDLETAVQKQKQLLAALSERRSASGGSAAKGSQETAGAQSAGSPARPEALDGPWSLTEDWAPCALGTVPSPLHPLGKVPNLDWRSIRPSEENVAPENEAGNGVHGRSGREGIGSDRGGVGDWGRQGAERVGAGVVKGDDGVVGTFVSGSEGQAGVENGSLQIGAARSAVSAMGANHFRKPVELGLKDLVTGDPVRPTATATEVSSEGGFFQGGSIRGQISPSEGDAGEAGRSAEPAAEGSIRRIQDGVCLGQSVRWLSLEEQARIRESICIY